MPPDRVFVVDPGNYTPYYDVNLCETLTAHGWMVEWWTSPYLFESIAAPPVVNVRHVFFRGVMRFARQPDAVGAMRVIRRALKALCYPLDLIRMDRALSGTTPAVLHVQWALLPMLDVVCWRRWQRRGWRVLYTAHDVNDLEGTTPRMLAGATRRLFVVADAVIAHSERDCAEIARSGADPARVHHVPLGGPGRFLPAPVTRADARLALDLDPARPTILFFGLLKPYKGIDVLLASLALVRKRIPDVLLLIASMPTGPERHIPGAVTKLGLAGHIRWNRSYVSTAQVGLHFAAADVVALPYRAASSSGVLLNAYAHARPVVATKVGAFPETVEHGRTGLLVPPDAPDAFADALIELLLDPAKARAMGQRARQYVDDHHNWSLIGARTAAIYESVAEGGSRGYTRRPSEP